MDDVAGAMADGLGRFPGAMADRLKDIVRPLSQSLGGLMRIVADIARALSGCLCLFFGGGLCTLRLTVAGTGRYGRHQQQE